MNTNLLRNVILKSSWILVFTLTSFFSFSQVTVMPDCSGNPPAGNTCQTATPICDLNGYCGTTSQGAYTADFWGQAESIIGCGFLGFSPCPEVPGIGAEFCGSIENNSFLTIVADATTISFNVWVFNSVNGDGIQLAVYDIPTCGVGAVDQLYCNGQLAPTGTNNFHNIVVNNLVPGNTYYIMIDGFGGDEADYVIGAEDGIATPVSIDPSEVTICVGETADLLAIGGDGTYNWDANADLNTTVGANVTATPPGVGTYTYTVNSSTGNPNCPSSTSAIATVIVEPCICTVTAQYSGPVCLGSDFDLSATDVIDGTYEWSGPGGFSSTDQNVNAVTPPQTPGDYTYTVVVTTASGTCQSDILVTVIASPTVNGGIDQSICEGDEVTLTADNPDGAAISWSNSVNDGAPFSPVITQNYTVTASLNGCSTTDEVEVIVTPIPQVNAGADQAICLGDEVTLTANNPSGAVVSWTNSVNDGVSFSPGATQTYTVTATVNGCSSSDEVEITVSPVPQVNAGVDQSVCEGVAVTLTADNPDGAVISWSNSVNDTDPFSPTSTQTYTVTATLNGCSSTDEVEVVVFPTPQVDAGSYGPFCDEDPIQPLIGSPAGGEFTINGIVVTSFDPALGDAEIIYTYTDANGCGSADTIFVTVDETPTAAFTATPLVGVPPLDVTITNESSGQTTGYSWFFGNGDSSTDDFIDYTTTYGESGTYEITLIVTNNGCSSSASATVVVAFPALTFNVPNVFTPNEDGSNDFFHFNLENAANFELSILNRWGNLMFETDDVNTMGWDGRANSGNPASEGTYFHKYTITDLEGNEITGHGFLHLVRD